LNRNAEKIWPEFLKHRRIEHRDKLVLAYLNLVQYIVDRMFTARFEVIDRDDLMSAGVIGLIKAIDRFDPAQKVKFETYASIRIQGEIRDLLRANDWVPRSRRKIARNIDAAVKRLEARLARKPTEDEISEFMGIDRSEFQKQKNAIAPARFVSLNSHTIDNSGEKTINEEKIADKEAGAAKEQELKEKKAILKRAIKSLPNNERLVMVLYYYENLTLKEIAAVMNLTESRISQLHTHAILEIRNSVYEEIT